MKRTLWLDLVGLAIFSAGAVVSSGCGSQTIHQIVTDPSRFRDRDVRVSGSVVDSYSFVNRGAYRIDDDTGELWVLSDRGVPRKGARVTVKGTIREGFNPGSFGDRVKLPSVIGSGLVMMESSHKANQ